ncbi:hypothetical protein RMR16_024995 (plasmid) [Agrobacterium sp. rho-13.3]|uniref:hypothetical protein n=1 Tax=Agrobacterium sp. rho-13.3 TaxID=3072980 RepID=UPI002A12C6FB|nr:hypothetical protein [Agrobacterium sp. rho-13.3]MDX8310209.1 hypothetical protein [Agrobacterium sp. rho-13.3]
MSYASLTSTALFAISIVAYTGGAAYALDGQDLLAKVNANTAQNGLTFTAGSIEVDGDDIHLKGLASAAVEYPGQKVELGNITLQDVEQREDGGYMIGRIDVPDITRVDGRTKVVAEGISIRNCQIAALPKGQTVDTLSFCRSVETGPVKIINYDKEFASIESMGYEISLLPDSAGLGFEAAVEGIYVNFVEAPKADAMTNASLKAAGLEEVKAGFASSGSWTLADGRMKLDESRLTIDDIGTLDFGFDISGYTLETIYALADETAALVKAKGDGVEQGHDPAVGIEKAILDMAGKVSLNSSFIRYEDDGLTEKLVEFFAKERGTSVSEFNEALKFTMEAQIAQFEPWLGAEFATSVKAAARDYLDDPESLIVAAKPTNTVPFMAVASAMSEPKTLIELLAVEVKANE